MMHYRKGKNVEKEIKKEDVPFRDCMPKTQNDFLWMHVKGGTKVNNVITYAKNALDKNEFRSIVWTGFGGGVGKTISCAEILKRSYPLYQVTRMCYTMCEEHWQPQRDDLEEIVVNRKIPCIHILLSLDAIDDDINGLQKPNTTTDFWAFSTKNKKPEEKHTNNNNNNNRYQRNDNKPSTSNRQQQQKSQSKPQPSSQNQAKKHRPQKQRKEKKEGGEQT